MRGSRRLLSWFAALLAVTGLPLAVAGQAAAAPVVPFPAGPQGPTPADAGTWLVATDGGVFAFGGAPFYGSMGGKRLNKPVVTMAATPSGKGYWLVASDGGVFAFGDAGFFGSTGSITLQKPIVTMAPTASGKGYWLVASDGGVFAFGDAKFLGSAAGGKALTKPVTGMTATATGNGYWLVTSDGQVITYGDAAALGSPAGTRLKTPVIGIAATPGGKGYWVATADGAVFTYGDAPYAGGVNTLRLNGPVVSMATAPRGLGYWLVGSDGGIFTFGDARFAGSLGGLRLAAPVVALAARPAVTTDEVSIFFYPWYSTPAFGGWVHWQQNNHDPDQGDIGANFFPAGGPYSALDGDVLGRQAKQMAAAGVDTVVSSWWGRGSFEDQTLAGLIPAVRGEGLRLAIHLEPYKGRSKASVITDLAYLRGLGIAEVYVYQADRNSMTADDWAEITATQPDMRFLAETGDLASMLSGKWADYTRNGGFDGIYTYDGVRFGAAEMAVTCGSARQRRLYCSPSVAPGFNGLRAGVKIPVVPAAGGQRYDDMWRWAFAAGADIVSITSFNEWHEGTQIEPAVPYRFESDGYTSPGYEGIYGRFGTAARTAYLDRTGEWARDFRALRSR